MTEAMNTTQVALGRRFDCMMMWEDYLDAMGPGASKDALEAHYTLCPDKSSDIAVYLKKNLNSRYQ